MFSMFRQQMHHLLQKKLEWIEGWFLKSLYLHSHNAFNQKKCDDLSRHIIIISKSVSNTMNWQIDTQVLNFLWLNSLLVVFWLLIKPRRAKEDRRLVIRSKPDLDSIIGITSIRARRVEKRAMRDDMTGYFYISILNYRGLRCPFSQL